MRVFEQFFHVTQTPIRFLGLWDTVSSMIQIRLQWGTIVDFGSHSSVNKNPSVQSVRHALSIDERRRFFRHQFWKEGQEYIGKRKKDDEDIIVPAQQDVKQVWFPGTHTDIAGSVKEDEAGLSKVSMVWMRDELDALGVAKLEFSEQHYNRYVRGIPDDVTKENDLAFCAPDATANLHSQMPYGWFLLEGLPRLVRRSEWPTQPGFLGYYLPLAQHRFIPDGAEIHPSAFERRKSDPGYNPPNLAKFPPKPD